MKNQFRKYFLYVIIIGSLSIFLGLIYTHLTPELFWFSFDFLGPEIGSESETVRLWGLISIIVGSILIFLSIVTMYKKSYLYNFYINVTFVGTIILIALQIIPIFLWVSIGIVSQNAEGIRAVLLHLLVILISIKISTLMKHIIKRK